MAGYRTRHVWGAEKGWPTFCALCGVRTDLCECCTVAEPDEEESDERN